MPELCSSLIDTTFKTYGSVSSCQSGWTLVHSPTTVLFLPSQWNVYSFKCKVFKTPSCKSSNTTLRLRTRSCDDFFICHLLFGLPSVRYLPSSYFITIIDNLRASFFSLSVRVSQPSKFVFMSLLWIFHDLCWQPAVFFRWTVSCI